MDYPSDDDYFDSCVSAMGPSYMSWEEWKEIAEFTGEIDFGCNFDCDGQCEGSRSNEPHNCCVNCADSYGYLGPIPIEAVETVKAIFNGGQEGNGFNGPNGCRLPMKWRSFICLGHKCEDTYSAEDSVEEAWKAYKDLVYSRDRNMTVKIVREKMRKVGLLKTKQLVVLV